MLVAERALAPLSAPPAVRRVIAAANRITGAEKNGGRGGAVRV
jgi:hypothetical protein